MACVQRATEASTATPSYILFFLVFPGHAPAMAWFLVVASLCDMKKLLNRRSVTRVYRDKRVTVQHPDAVPRYSGLPGTGFGFDFQEKPGTRVARVLTGPVFCAQHHKMRCLSSVHPSTARRAVGSTLRLHQTWHALLVLQTTEQPTLSSSGRRCAIKQACGRQLACSTHHTQREYYRS